MPALPQPRRVPRQSRSRALVDAILEATARVLTERGYAGTNTNLVAERAGVSVGSVYQYFPNKDSLITALHERHALDMQTAMDTVLAGAAPLGLRGKLAAIVHAWLAAHQVAPELHRVLEQEFPFFDAPPDQSPADQSIRHRIRQLLEDHRDEVAPPDRELATWMVLQTMESLIHAAVIPPGAPCPARQVEQAIVNMLTGYLCGSHTREV
ncbi:TetR family transcriptional regulator [Comamonas serinivorans]|uniref:TetR family transcriptional regulator n=1 Tax=Comamonas serinivorans TaxID=1082851 RepID=A0A1Y0EP04_9BURK|nr:TetR/AcrR family transcriptional regulator [Comamonas serinivorans]ARU05188.1 TetR family transcriptional regulator [Comamonas serinivorans]